MRPVLFFIFGLPVYSYGVCISLAVMVMVFWAAKNAPRAGFTAETVVDLTLAVTVGCLIGARIVFVLVEWEYYRAHPWEIFNLRAGGLSFFGAVLGGFVAARFYARHKRLPFWRLADFAVPYVALGYAIGRIGCLLNGCCYGVPTRVPWALPCAAGDPTLRHPTQIYASIGSFLLFILLYRLREHRRFPGFLFFLYLVLYAVMRGIIEIFRDSLRVMGPWRLTQFGCLLLALFALEEIWRRERRWRKGDKGKDGRGEEMDSRSCPGRPAT